MHYLSISNTYIVCCILFVLLTVKDVDCNKWVLNQLKKYGYLKPPDTATANLQSNKDCSWCVWASCSPSVPGDSAKYFNAVDDTRRITSTLRFGINIKKEELIQILTSRSELQRQAIEREYKIQNGVELSDTLDKLTFFRTNKILTSLSTPLQKYFAMELHKATERKYRFILTQTFTTLSACLIREIRKYYEEIHGEGSLENDITAALTEDFPKSDYIDILLIMSRGERDETKTVNKAEAKKDAQNLVTVIKTDVWKPKITTFQEVFTKRSIPQLKEIIYWYGKIREKDKEFESIEVDIENGMDSVQEIYIYMINIVRDQHMYFAERLETLFNIYHKHKNTDDLDDIMLIIRGRSDIDLGDIQQAYQKKYNVSLYAKLVRGNMRPYRKALLDLVQS